MSKKLNEQHIYYAINKHNLYINNIKTYVELFTDGSYFFWHKPIAFTQYINDVNKKLNNFYSSIRNNNINQYSIYTQHEKYTVNINEIINSQFYKRMDRTYIFDRNYKDIIKATESQDTFFYCQIDELTLQLFLQLNQIKGKVLIICCNTTTEFEKYIESTQTNFQFLIDYGMQFYFNYNNVQNNKQELF